MKTLPTIMQSRTLHIKSKKDVWKYGLKNSLFSLLTIIPIAMASHFNLSNTMYAVGLFCILVGVLLSLFLRIGGASTLSFYSESIIINSGKNNLITISKAEIVQILLLEFSGSRPAFIIEIDKADGNKIKLQIDKFRFQNPRKKLEKIKNSEEWKDLLTRKIH